MGFSTLISLLNFLLNVYSKRNELLNDLKSFATSLPNDIRKCCRTNTFRKINIFMIRFVFWSMLFAGLTVSVITFKGSFIELFLSIAFSVFSAVYILKGLNTTSKYISVLKIV